jgi:hypothetical protein
MTTPFLLLMENAAAVAFQQTRKSAKRVKNIHRHNRTRRPSSKRAEAFATA